jgi:hypothetical protein
MNMSKSSLLILAVALSGALPATAQPASSSLPNPTQVNTEMAPKPKVKVASTGGNSPHETFSVVLGDRRNGNRVTIVYGRPYSADPKTGEIRKIWGDLIGGAANPWGKAWRAGSDEATLLITQKPILVGDAAVAPGAYTLFLVPLQDGSAKLVINKQIGQWGLQYDQSQDLARVDLKKDNFDQRIDQFTMAITKGKDGNGLLKLKWENTQYSVPITLVK